MTEVVESGQTAPVEKDEAGQTAATPETVAAPVDDTQAQPDVKTEAAEKTFTQAELDEIVAKRTAKAEAIANRRALKAYRETLERFAPPKQEQTPQTNDAPKREAFASDEDWLNARDEWRDIKRFAEQRLQEQQRQAQTLAAKTDSFYAEAEKIPGFDREVFDELPLTQAIAAALIESDAPAKLMAHMSAHPDEVERIAALSPMRQAVEIGKLEVAIATAPKASNAPPPIKPIGGNKGSVDKDPGDMTDAEFAKWRKAQIAQRR